MEPTIKPNQFVVADPNAYKTTLDVRIGHLAVYIIPHSGEPSVKRVVALPGDRLTLVALDKKPPVLHVNGKAVEPIPGVLCRAGEDNHESINAFLLSETLPYTIPADHVFVVGDNVGLAADSRFYGPIPFTRLRGRAISIDGKALP